MSWKSNIWLISLSVWQWGLKEWERCIWWQQTTKMRKHDLNRNRFMLGRTNQWSVNSTFDFYRVEIILLRRDLPMEWAVRIVLKAPKIKGLYFDNCQRIAGKIKSAIFFPLHRCPLISLLLCQQWRRN